MNENIEEQKLLKRKEKFLKNGNKASLAAVCNNLAEFYFRRGHYEDSIKEYSMEAKLYLEMGKKINYGIANRMIGEVYATMAEFVKALKYQEKHLVVANEEGNKLEEQRALATVGRTYLTKAMSCAEVDSHSLKMANKSFMKSLMICESLKQISKQEQMDMRARLLLNIGVVQEYQGNFDKGIEYMVKAIQICKTHDIYEQLHQGYSTLGLLYSKKGDYGKSVTYLNLALETASRLSDKVPPMCGTLVAKAEVFFKLADFQSAKNVLLKAYKLKSPNEEERESIEHHLKVVAAMCYTEDSLLAAPDSDYKLKKQLYEKMGDGACELKNFSKAIDYYKKMLECAEANGDTGKDLVPCYVSLAQTYKDNDQFELAIEYFQKEYSISRNNPKDGYVTLLNIAQVFELAQKKYEAVMEIYQKARSVAKSTGEVRIEGKVISQMINFQKKCDKFVEAHDLEEELRNMNYVSDDESDKEIEATPKIGEDIAISEISDLSAESDQEEISRPRQIRKRSGFVVKKNIKGETQLHTACIAGNLTLVRRYIDQGHPINIRDNCGWLPIHEACICGHQEIVELLIEKGANINDRGGTLCNGITPLHDAASNGHLEVVGLLLQHGASLLSQTDTGDTPLDVLRTWRASAELDENEEIFYQTLVSKMTTALEKTGHSFKVKDKVQSQRKSPKEKTPLKQIDNLRYKIDVDSDPDEPSQKYLKKSQNISPYDSGSNSDTETFVQKEYKKVMSSLRKRLPDHVKKKQRSPKLSALVSAKDIQDDWLEDDLQHVQPNKKRRTDSSCREFLNSTGTRAASTNRIYEPSTSRTEIEINSDSNDAIESVPSNTNSETDNIINSDEDHTANSSTSRRKSQSSLLDSGFYKSNSPVKSSPSYSRLQVNRTHKRQTKISSFAQVEPDLTINIEPSQLTQTSQVLSSSFSVSMMAINVKIENQLWRIPVKTNDIENLTIGWLASEAAKRYYCKEGIKPTLQLQTKDGAILMNEDPLSMVFLSPTQPEEVQSVVVSWNLPPLPEKYIEVCRNMKIDVDSVLRDRLDEAQGSLNLNLSNFSIKKPQLTSLLRALNRQNNMQLIDLSGNSILNEGIEQFCKILPSISQLRILNLALNGISMVGLGRLSEVLSNSRSLLRNLTHLDLSHNLLQNECLRYISTILDNVRLQTLALSGCNLTNELFNVGVNSGVHLNFEALEVLDLSYNELDKDAIVRFMSFLNYDVVSSLNFSHNLVSESGIGKELALGLQQCACINVKSLELSRCCINDYEIWELLRSLLNANQLKLLDLSHNKDITSVSLRRLIQYESTPTCINLGGCSNIFQYFEESTANIEPSPANSLKILKLGVNSTTHEREINMLSAVWARKWGEKAKIEEFFDSFTQLSVSD